MTMTVWPRRVNLRVLLELARGACVCTASCAHVCECECVSVNVARQACSQCDDARERRSRGSISRGVALSRASACVRLRPSCGGGVWAGVARRLPLRRQAGAATPATTTHTQRAHTHCTDNDNANKRYGLHTHKQTHTRACAPQLVLLRPMALVRSPNAGPAADADAAAAAPLPLPALAAAAAAPGSATV